MKLKDIFILAMIKLKYFFILAMIKIKDFFMKDFNLEEESKFIQYLDANNLYSWAMSQPLPIAWKLQVDDRK